MKRFYSLLFAVLFIVACTQDKLEQAKALQLIRESRHYPKLVGYEIYVADPNQVSKLTNTTLQRDGFITVEEVHSLGEIGKRLIFFTEKASPYLIPETPDDDSRGIQRVKIAEEEITGIQTIKYLNDGKEAEVGYQIGYQNISPFSSLISIDFNKKRGGKAYFSLSNEGWQIKN